MVHWWVPSRSAPWIWTVSWQSAQRIWSCIIKSCVFLMLIRSVHRNTRGSRKSDLIVICSNINLFLYFHFSSEMFSENSTLKHVCCLDLQLERLWKPSEPSLRTLFIDIYTSIVIFGSWWLTVLFPTFWLPFKPEIICNANENIPHFISFCPVCDS